MTKHEYETSIRREWLPYPCPECGVHSLPHAISVSLIDPPIHNTTCRACGAHVHLQERGDTMRVWSDKDAP